MNTSDSFPRRRFLQGVVATASVAVAANARAQSPAPSQPAIGPYSADVLPPGIRSRVLDNINGIRVHVLEAGFETPKRRAVLLIHGFPELAYSWWQVMPQLAAAGYHVFAPDLRGYGRTGGTEVSFDDDLGSFRTFNRVTDMVALVSAFGYRSLAAVVGHDVGSGIAGWCGVVRPDIFRSVVMMSAPFGGPPALPFATVDAAAPRPAAAADTIYADLARLNPPRQYYMRYYSTREANHNMWKAPQGVHAFLRAYYHMKSADWKANAPAPLKGRTAEEWAKMPRYYVMDLNKGMAENVAPEMPTAAEIQANKWLPDEALKVYAAEYGRTGFQGGLQSYRLGQAPRINADLATFSGRTIDQPSLFISGKSDWGVYQTPGALERMQKVACTRMVGVHLLDGAGHWVQQEQAAATAALLLDFFSKHSPA
jgi:pimeloyl-ACP methyl ester carboxylesterase